MFLTYLTQRLQECLDPCVGQVTREWHSRQCPRSLGTYRKPGVRRAQRRGSHTKSPGFWKSFWGRSLERPKGKRILQSQQDVGCGRKHEERHRREKSEQCAHAQHKQMAEQKRMPRLRAWWRRGCRMETINCLEHEVLFGHAKDMPRKHQVEEPGLRG